MASWNNRIRARGSARQIRLMARRSSQIRTQLAECPYWPEGKAPRTSVRNGETVASAPGAARSHTARQVRLKARRSSRIRTHDSESRPGAPYWPEGEAPRTSVRKPKPECQDGVPGWLAAEASFAVRQNGEIPTKPESENARRVA